MMFFAQQHLVTKLRHRALTELCQDLRLSAGPDLYHSGTSCSRRASLQALKHLRASTCTSARAAVFTASPAPIVKTLDGFDFVRHRRAGERNQQKLRRPRLSERAKKSFLHVLPGVGGAVWRFRLRLSSDAAQPQVAGRHGSQTLVVNARNGAAPGPTRKRRLRPHCRCLGAADH